MDLLVHDQSLDVVDLSTIQVTEDLKAVLPSNYINMNFVAPFKMEGKTLHIAISDSSKLGLMRNLKAITKKNIELHAARVSQISEFIEKILSESGDVTPATIRKENKEKTKTFDSDLGEAGEVLEKTPEEDIEALENESEVIKFGNDKIKNSLVIQTETSPIPLYENEKPFSYVCNQLENLGFNLHMFSKIHNRSFKPMIFDNNIYSGLYHLFQLIFHYALAYPVQDLLLQDVFALLKLSRKFSSQPIIIKI